MPIILAIVLAVLAIFGTTTANAAQPATEDVSQVTIPSQPAPEVGVPTLPIADCQEDDPCWDCETMGNGQCGPVSQPATPAPTVDYCEEDEPCWDCETMGNKVCGPANVEADAYLSYDSLGVTPNTDGTLMLEYVSSYTTTPVQLSEGQFTVPSVQTEGLTHVLQWTAVSHA